MNKFESPLAAFIHWEKTIPNNVMFKQPLNGKVTEFTYKRAGDEIRRMATALQSKGYPQGSKIALISKNCAHWVMADLAIMMSGYVSVPLYPTLGADMIKHILEHSESKAIIIGKLEEYEKTQKAGVVGVDKISVNFFGESDGETWDDLIKKHGPMAVPVKVGPKDLVTIIYTSGTTGLPKGVMHRNESFAKTSEILLNAVNTPKHPDIFSYLPLSHIAERIGISMQSLYRGATISFPESLATFPADLGTCSPHFFFAVPRIWGKFQEKILIAMPQKKLNFLLKIPIVNGIVKKKIRGKLGLGRAGYIVSGAAPISLDLLHWYEKLDIVIHQVYGMTEDCILSHFNTVGQNKMGSVGKPLPSVTAKLSDEGEVLIKSACLMGGYYKEPEKTTDAFTSDGFLRTGDMGEYDKQGYLTIVGRVKDQFKTDKGKYVAPAPIELKLSANPAIEQLCLVGFGIAQPIVLMNLSEEGQSMSKADLAASLSKSLAELNPTLAPYEKIKKVVVLKKEWTLENNILTPTMKIKRNVLEKEYIPSYKGWYDTKDEIVFGD
jgi:long-chain acyl-CoA synthetase